MKRFAAILLVLILVLSLCACGKKHVEEDSAAPGVEEHTDEEKQPKKPIPEVTKPEDTKKPVTDGKTASLPANKPTEKTDDSSSSGGGYHGGGGHHSGGEDTPTVQNLTITEEKTVSGGEYNDVIIDADVGNGTVTLNGVKINGQLIVRGGGSNSIKVVDCDVSAVVLDKDTSGENAQAPRLELTGTEVQSVEVSQPAIIEATDTASAVQELSAKDSVTIKGEKTEIASVIVPTDAENDVTLTVNDASVAKVEVNKPVTIETSAAAGKTPVAAVEAKADVTVSGAATNVGTVTVPADAGNDVKLKVEDAKVNSVSAEAPVTIEANEYAAKIDSVEAKADVTVAGENTKIDTITVPETVTTKPAINVSAGSVNTVEAKSEASVSGGSNAIANVEAAAPVEVNSAAVAKVTVTVNVTVTVTGSSSVEVAVEVETSGSETVAIEAVNATVNVSTTQEDAPTVKVNNEAVTHIHKWVESGRVNAGCKTPGSITYTCSETGCTEITKIEVIPAKGHTEVVIPAVDPTCTAAGHTAGKKCAVCDETIVATRETSALGHDFTGSYVSDETAHWHVCSYCGETDTEHTHTYSTTNCTVAARCTECGYQKAAGVHTWNAGTVQAAASCDTAGSMLYTCTSCAATKTETIPALGHIYGTPVFSWSGTNCTAERTCTREGCSHADSKIAQVSSYELKEPSCTEDGVTVYTATVVFDGKTYSATTNVTVNATGHTGVKQNGQAATCEENGWNDYYKCSKCQKLFSDKDCENEITNLGVWKTGVGKVAALGHDWAEAWNRDAAGHWHVCQRQGCNATSTKESHVPGAAATETAAQTCTVCGYELAPATGHLCVNHLTKTDAVAATCTQPGNSAYWSCTCGKYYSDAAATQQIAANSWVIAALDHAYGTTPAWNWTGYTSAAATFTCTREGCGHTETVNATITNEVTTTAGCETTGVRTYTATVSFGGQTYTDTKTADISATGHTAVKQNGQAATCEENGWNDYYKCSKCQKLFSDADCKNEITNLGVWKNSDGKLAALGHDWAEAWNRDAAGHWHVCQRQGCNATSTKESHVPGAAATETAAQTCTACGYELAPATGHLCVNHLTEHPATAATCTAAGNSAYWSCTCGNYYSDDTATQQIAANSWVIAALNHAYGATPTWSWTGYTSATATFTCTREGCGHTETVDATITNRVTTAAGNDTEGVRTYTATANFDEKTYTNTKAEAIPALIKTVATADEFVAGLADTARSGVKVTADITLSADTIIPAGKSVEIASGKTLTLNGELRVYGTMTNHGTITGNKNVEVYGGKLENEGIITLSGESVLLTIEKGAVLNNFVGDINTAQTSGTINADINFVDYYYADTEYLCRWNVVEDDHTLDIDGNSRMVIAAVFDINKISTVLDKTIQITVDGGIKIDIPKYNAFLLSGTETSSTVHLGGVTVPEGMLMILKDSVFDGTATYHNSFVVDNRADMVVSKNAKLFSRGGASLTVASGSKLTANGNMRLENLTVDGHVYTEEGGLDVTTALTVNAGGVLEIGSGSSLNYSSENAAVINGKLIKTVRNVNGFDQQIVSTISGVTPNATMTTLVFWDNIVLTGEHTVDTVVAYSGSLRVAPGGSLKYKDVYRGNGYTGTIVGPTTRPDDEGYTTLTANDTTVTDYEGFAAALKNNSVTYITVNANIIVPSGEEWKQLDITKPVVIADGKTFTVAHYTGNATKNQLIMNEVVIKDGGSLTLGNNAVLKATEKRWDPEKEMFYRYFGRIYVENGGKLDVSAGTVTSGSAIYYDYGEDSKTPDSSNIVVGQTRPDNLAFIVWDEDQLRGAMADPKCTGGIEADTDIELTKDLSVDKYLLINDGKKLTVPTGKKLTVPTGKELQLSGQLYVYGGTVINHGTIYGFDVIDFFGGQLENDGTIEGMFAPNDRGEIECISTLIIEKGAVLHNYTGSKESASKVGTITDVINFGDYWYADGTKELCTWDVLPDDHTLDGMGENITVIAAAFSPEQVQAALATTTSWGEEPDVHTVNKYGVVVASGTAEKDGVVTLTDIHVGPYQTLMLKEWVDVGDKVYHNTTYNLSNITFGEKAGLVIMGSPVINVDGSMALDHVSLRGEPIINAPGFVSDATELKTALAEGGDVYLNPFAMEDRNKEDFTFEDGHTETVYETQYRIDENFTISNDVNLINVSGSTMAVFFKNGFTVAAGKTLKFNGLNVVAAADSTVNGNVEVHNGKLVVQANSAKGAKLTNKGIITIYEDGALAIFDLEGYLDNHIANNGTIWLYGKRIYDNDQFDGTAPENPDAMQTVNVQTTDEFMAALGRPNAGEIHVTADITLNGYYYKDGQPVDAGTAGADGPTVYLEAAGRDRNRERKIIVDPGVTLTLEENVKMDIQPGVELCLADGDDGSNGKLELKNGSGLNVFGGLKPDNWNYEFGEGDDRQRKYVIEEEGSYINFFPDVMEFAKRLWERVDDRLAPATPAEIASYTNLANEWPGGDDDRVAYFAALVKYDTLQPRKEREGNDFRMVWRPYDKVQYNEAMNILDNLWKGLFDDETMPAGIRLNDVGRPDEWLDNDRVDRLIDLFEKFVQAKDSGAVMVDSIEALTAALPNGGDIYLLALPKASMTDVYMDGGHSLESQYHIGSNTDSTYEISSDTNLIGMANDLAVFFDGGFTVASDTTLRFDGLNVVAAANNSTVNGRVEICNGILVVQANSQNGATLTNLGTIQVGNPNCDGKLAIFPKQDKNGTMLFEGTMNIVNRGTIERFGDIINWDWNRETDHEPLEFVNYADVVQDLYHDFGEMPNMDPLEDNDKENLVDVYPDSQEMYHEDGSDDEALDGFAWLIKNDIVPGYNKETNPELRPHHYVTRDEVQNLFNAFARKVLATDTDLVNIVANDDDDDAERLLCRTKNIKITEQDGNKWYISERDQCFDALREALNSLQSTEVADEAAFMEALCNSLLTEVHVTGDIELNGYYYKDGQQVETGTEDADGPAVYLEAAGRDHNEHREIIVESNASLTVAEDVKMDIRQNVKLRVDNGGQLIVKGNVNVFGELEPDENDESRITIEEGGNISYFGNAYFFGERLLEVAGEYMSQKDVIPEGYDRIDGWSNDGRVKCLVAYGLEPQEDNGHKWWDFGRTPEYGEMKTVLTKVYRDALATSSDLPGNVKAGDERWTPNDDDCLDNRSVEELLSRFALELPKLNDTTTNSFVIKRTNDENNTDGKTIIGKTFTQAITVTAVKTNDNFAGELNFVNCTFNGGITLVYNPDCDYRVNFNDSCTGAVTTVYSGDATGGDRRIRIAHPNGMTITANALTAFEMNDGWLCSTDSFTVNGLTINGNGCGNLEVDVRKDYTIPTIEVTGSENGNDIKLSGSCTGKLRVSGCIDVGGVTLGTDSCIELANWYDEENDCGAPNSTINLGTNDISINEDNGSHSFTGTGTIHVNNGPKANLKLTVNGRNLANPHVFGGEGSYAIFLGLADVNGVTFEVKQGDDALTGNTVRYDHSGIAEGSDGFDGSNVEKTHLEKGGENWITEPGNISLTVKVTNGCKIVYEKLRYNGQ